MDRVSIKKKFGQNTILKLDDFHKLNSNIFLSFELSLVCSVTVVYQKFQLD